MGFILLLFFVIIFWHSPMINASAGDVSPFFRRCLASCSLNFHCPAQHPTAFVWWANEQCFSCRQNCIWGTVEKFKQKNRGIPQFFGKWPFAPLTLRPGPFFIQEPASVVFSLFNFFSVLAMQRRIRRNVPHGHPCRSDWIQFGWAGALTWICSALFHICDCWHTEALDYGAGLGLILFTLYASCSFVAPALSISRGAIKFIGAALFFFYVRYLHSMFHAPRFDYGFHMRFCLCLSLLTALIYATWAFLQIWKGETPKTLSVLVATFLLGWFSAAFDALVDFPPLFWLFDAHALFHLFSIPVPLLWAEFICRETKAQYEEKTA